MRVPAPGLLTPSPLQAGSVTRRDAMPSCTRPKQYVKSSLADRSEFAPETDHQGSGAGDGDRTRDIQLGKLTFYL